MGYNTRSSKTPAPKINKAVKPTTSTTTTPKYSSKVIFDGQKSNKKYYTKQIVYEKTNETPTTLKELGEISKAFSNKMKKEDQNNKISIIGYTPLGWRTFLSFDNSLLMTDEDFDDYFSNRVTVPNQEKFTEISQFILSVNKPIVSKSGVMKMKK